MQKFVVFFVLSTALAGCQTHFATPPSPAALAANPDGYKLKRTGTIFSGYYYSRKAEPFDGGEAHQWNTSFDPLFASYPETREGLKRVNQYKWLSYISLGLADIFIMHNVHRAHEHSDFRWASPSRIAAKAFLVSSLVFTLLADHKFGTLGDAYNAAMERAILENQNLDIAE